MRVLIIRGGKKKGWSHVRSRSLLRIGSRIFSRKKTFWLLMTRATIHSWEYMNEISNRVTLLLPLIQSHKARKREKGGKKKEINVWVRPHVQNLLKPFSLPTGRSRISVLALGGRWRGCEGAEVGLTKRVISHWNNVTTQRGSEFLQRVNKRQKPAKSLHPSYNLVHSCCFYTVAVLLICSHCFLLLHLQKH